MSRILPAICLLFLLLGMPQIPRAQQTISFAVTLPTLPVAAFSYAINGLDVNFQDASGGNPITWAWDFGDGGTSTLPQPTHTYSTNGSYEVCLTVENAGGCSDRICDTLRNLVALDPAMPDWGLTVVPNPFVGNTHIRFNLQAASDYELLLFDLSGRKIRLLASEKDFVGNGSFDFAPAQWGLGAGMYFVVLQADGQSLARKVICVE